MTLNMDTMTIKLQEALTNAQNKAVSCANQQIEPEHLMLSLLQQKESLVPSLLSKFGLSLRNISEYLENTIFNCGLFEKLFRDKY